MRTWPGLQKVYRRHHLKNKRDGFTFWGEKRGKIFSRLISTQKKILDLGCRDGSLTNYYVSGNNIIGVDIDERLLSQCRENLGIKTMVFDLNSQNWPFQKESFDVVVAGEVMEHLFNPKDVLLKIKKLLKKNGLLVGSVPNSFHLIDRVKFIFGNPPRGFADETHVNIFSYHSLLNLLLGHFHEVSIIPVTVDRYGLLARILPTIFSDDLVFIAKRK